MFKFSLLWFTAISCKLATDAAEQGSNIFLINAVQENKKEIVEWLISKKAFLDIQDGSGMTPLMHAATSTDSLDIVKILLNAGAKLDIKNNHGATAMHIAVEFGSLNTLKLLCSNISTDELADNQGRTLLHVAAMRGEEGIVNFLTNQGENPLKKDKKGLTVIHLAAMEGQLNFLKLWSNWTSYLDKEVNRTTPLMLAITSGHESSAKLLIEAGANVNCRDANFSTPLHAAAFSGNFKLTGLLIDNGAIVYQKDILGQTPLFLATENGHLECLSYIIKKNGSRDTVDINGNTLLHAAAASGNINVFKLFLNNSYSINVRNNNGTTPLIVASGKGHFELVRWLINLGADYNIMDQTNDCFVFSAISFGQLNILREIKETHKSLSFNMSGVDGKTSLHFASQKGKTDLISFLIEEIVSESYLSMNKSDSRLKRATLKTPFCPLCYKQVLNMKDKYGKTPIYYAAEAGNIEAVTVLKMYGGKMDIPDNDGLLPLHAAAYKGQNKEVLNFIILHFDNLEAKDKADRTPLFLSAIAGHLDSLKHLINVGANITGADNEGRTVMHLAAANGRLNIVSELIKYKQLLNKTDSKGKTPAWYAVMNNHTESLRKLLQSNAIIKPELNIFQAVENGDWNVASYLFNECDSPTSTDSLGRTLMHIAASKGHNDIILELAKYKCLINRVDHERKSPAFYSLAGNHWTTLKLLESLEGKIKPNDYMFNFVKDNNLEMLKYLIENGVNVNVKNQNGQTLIMEAIKYSNDEIVQYLISKQADIKGADNGYSHIRAAINNNNCYIAKVLAQNGASVQRISYHDRCYDALYNYRYG